jgi:putative ABC transport system permease protein
MFSYYLDLAIRSLRRNKVLTTLMVLSLALGIGACITTLTVYRLLSGDPLPQKSAQLFYPQLDPYPKDQPFSRSDKMPWLMTYVDAMNLLHARKAQRQALMAMTQIKVTPPVAGRKPFFSDGVMTTADFFPMFDVPFQYGSGWNAADDDGRVPVAVIAGFLNDKLFGGTNSVGRELRINERVFRIVGVLKHWEPEPRFYGLRLGGHDYGQGDAVFFFAATVGAGRGHGAADQHVFRPRRHRRAGDGEQHLAWLLGTTSRCCSHDGVSRVSGAICKRAGVIRKVSAPAYHAVWPDDMAD